MERGGALYAFVESDQSLVPPVRSALERGSQAVLQQQLQTFVAAQDAEIQGVCSTHYKEFLRSVSEVLRMNIDAVALKDQATVLREAVLATGDRAAEVAASLQALRLRRRNIDTAIEAVGQCQQVAALAAKTKRLIVAKRYYAALAAATELEALLAAQGGGGAHRFAAHAQQWLPLARRRVRNEVLVDFSSWLVLMRGLEVRLGAAALCRTTRRSASVAADAAARRVLEAVGDDEALAAGEQLAAFETLSEHFAPVHRCLYVMGALGREHERGFAQLYTSSRRARGSDGPIEEEEGSIVEWLPQACRALAGFFIVESSLASTLEAEGHALLSTSAIEQMWLTSIMRLGVSLSQYLQECAVGDAPEGLSLDGYVRSSTLLRQMCDTMSAAPWSYNTAPLQKLLLRFAPGLNAVLKRHIGERFQRLLDEEPFAPFSVANAAELAAKVARYGLDEGVVAGGFPLVLPFSSTVPAAWQLVEDTVALVDVLVGPMELSASQLADALGSAADVAIAHVADLFHASLDNTDLVIAQACQIAINAASMADSAPAVRQLVREASRREAAAAAAAAAALTGEEEEAEEEAGAAAAPVFSVPAGVDAAAVRRTLDDVSNRARDLIFELVRGKVDELMAGPDMAPSSMPLGPSGYVSDVTSYLQVTLMCLTNLPHTVREAVHFASCAHISSNMLNYLLGPGVKTTNVLGLVGLSHDVRAMVEFADSCGVPQLADCFAQLRQLSELLVSGNVEQILDEEVRATQFPLVDSAKLCALLEKHKDLGARAMLTGVGAGAPTLKRKTAESIVRSLS